MLWANIMWHFIELILSYLWRMQDLEGPDLVLTFLFQGDEDLLCHF